MCRQITQPYNEINSCKECDDLATEQRGNFNLCKSCASIYDFETGQYEQDLKD